MTSDMRQCGMRSAECGKGNAHGIVATISILLAVAAASAAYALDTAPVATSSAVSVMTTTAVADRVLAIENHYLALPDLLANVTQKNFLKAVDKTQVFEGTLSIKKPGKLRLEYTNGQVIVVDGKEAWFYSKKSEQVIRRTFKDFEQANIPVAFLLGAGAIRQDFAVTVPEGGAEGVLDLVPKKTGAAMQKLRLHTTEAGRISRMIVFDRSGNQSDIRFSEVRENVGLEDGRFRFKVPKGTEIIEQ